MSHIYYELYYHIVWSTKRREDIIDDGINELLKNQKKHHEKNDVIEVLEFAPDS